MRARSVLPLLVLVFVSTGCKELPEIAPGVCGNRVIEPPEDCDGFDRDGVPCRPPGSVGECRLDCSPDDDGAAAKCPVGWGCFEGAVCRPATGEFQTSDTPIPGNAWSLLAGDFDGDGHDDVVSFERPMDLGITKIRVHYFDEHAELFHTYVSEKLSATPTVSDVSGDSRADITYSFGSVFVLAGEQDHSLLSETFPSYFLGGSPARALFVTEEPVDQETGIAVFATLDSTDAIFVFDPDSPFLRPIVELPAGVEAFASDPLVGNFFEDESEFPCDEFVVAYRDATDFSVYSLCDEDSDGALHWRDEPYVEVVTLEPPAALEQGLVVADFDGDAHLDILVGTAQGPYVAYGDGTELGTARPYSVNALDGSIAPDSMPLAAGDITADGVADLVFPNGLALSMIDSESGNVGHVMTQARFGPPWSEARFGDLNADGRVDLACASDGGLGIDIFLGTKSLAVNPFTVSTEGPTEHLVIRDFDGDLVNDLAFAELNGSSDDAERISIAFGRTSGGPESPVPAAHFEVVDQITTFSGDPTQTVANMFVLFSETTRPGHKEHAIGFLLGSSDRSPASPVELTTFAADGSVLSSTSAALTVGSFRSPGQIDVLPFGLAPSPGGFEDAAPEMWLLQDIASKSRGPESIGWKLDPRTQPLGGPNGPTELSLRLAAKDVDGDKVDELVAVAPSVDGEQCIVNVAGVPGDPPVLELRDVVTLDTPCYDAALDVVDLDEDGAPDIVLLAGDPNARSLWLLWNDGHGRFSSGTPRSVAIAGGDPPRAFTSFRSFDETTLLAYVTDSSLRLLRPLGRSRDFEDAGLVANLEQGTGIVGADVDGDGIVDLAVADAGSIRIFRAELAP